ncbi:MAG: peroxiredoxin [Acidothermaceae bacterium]
MTLEVGRPAPDFELVDQHGTPVRLSSFRGTRHVLLVFFPWAFSGVCTGELTALRDDTGAFVNETTQLLAVSIDSKFVQRRFAEHERLDFPLLADSWPHGEVARAYEVFDATAGAALRGTFVIDRDGVLRWSVVHGIGEARDPADYVRALAELG